MKKLIVLGLSLFLCMGSVPLNAGKGSWDFNNNSLLMPLAMWLGSEAVICGSHILNAKALAARTPKTFKKYKQAAAVVESFAALLKGGYTASFMRQKNLLFTVLGLFSVWSSLNRIRNNLNHASHSEQLHMMLQTPVFKAQFQTKNWSTVAAKRIKTELAVRAAMVLAAEGARYVQDEPKEYWPSFLGAMVAGNFVSSTMTDKTNAVGVENVFDQVLARDKQFEEFQQD